MTGGIVPIQILVLHTFDNVRDYLAETFHSSLRLLNHKVDVFDGNHLDHETALALLKKNYDFIFLNLQLPSGLSVRMAELAQLAKVQTRLVLLSGSMIDAERVTPLFDVFIRVPCTRGELESAIWSTSALAGLARTSLPTEEHVEAAIRVLVEGDSSGPTVAHIRGFEDYRAYFPLPESAVIKDISANASLAQRLSAFAVSSPADYCPRLARAVLTISQSQLLNTTLKLFLMDQFVAVSNRIGNLLRDQPGQIAKLLELLESLAALLAGKRRDLNAAELTDPVKRIPGFEPLANLTQYVLSVLASERSA